MYAQLEKYIYGLREKNPKGLEISNRAHSWHSPYFDISKSQILKKFVSKVSPIILKIAKESYAWKCDLQTMKICGMWAIINNQNSYNVRHFHPKSILSAAYYVKAKENCGNIKFFDPVDQKSMIAPPKIKNTQLSAEAASFKPSEGDLLVFPSYLHHSVDENLSGEERIVISFNVDMDNKF